VAWSSLELATRFRGVARSISLSVLQAERPEPRFGVVAALPTGGRCSVTFQGDEDSVPVRCFGVLPTVVGQRVMVDGPRKLRYIAQVWNAPIVVPPDDGGE
jgi:hypothetical protein